MAYGLAVPILLRHQTSSPLARVMTYDVIPPKSSTDLASTWYCIRDRPFNKVDPARQGRKPRHVTSGVYRMSLLRHLSSPGQDSRLVPDGSCPSLMLALGPDLRQPIWQQRARPAIFSWADRLFAPSLSDYGPTQMMLAECPWQSYVRVLVIHQDAYQHMNHLNTNDRWAVVGHVPFIYDAILPRVCILWTTNDSGGIVSYAPVGNNLTDAHACVGSRRTGAPKRRILQDSHGACARLLLTSTCRARANHRAQQPFGTSIERPPMMKSSSSLRLRQLAGVHLARWPVDRETDAAGAHLRAGEMQWSAYVIFLVTARWLRAASRAPVPIMANYSDTWSRAGHLSGLRAPRTPPLGMVSVVPRPQVADPGVTMPNKNRHQVEISCPTA